jgi:hypothetical protein
VPRNRLCILIVFSSQELVWSGARLFNQHNVAVFEASKYNGGDGLAFNVFLAGDVSNPNTYMNSGVILDNSYQVREVVWASNGTKPLNMHEFRLVDDGRHGLVVTLSHANTTQPRPDGTLHDGQVPDNGFEEIDTSNNKTLFSWSALDHIPIAESQMFRLPSGSPDP